MRRIKIIAGCLLAFAFAGPFATSTPCLAGPNLVANGALDLPEQQATFRPNPTGDGGYWSCADETSFGRVVLAGTTNVRRYLNSVYVGYAELGKAATGGWRGLVIDTSKLNAPAIPGTISIWFDLLGAVRPNRTYEYSFTVIAPGKKQGEGQTLKIIAPAMWIDGKPTGAEFELEFDGVPEARVGKIKMPEFTRQTGAASLVFEIPRDFKGQLIFTRVVFREIDEELLAGKEPEMPVPIRYIPAQSDIEFRIEEALRESSNRMGQVLVSRQVRRPGGPGAGDSDEAVMEVAVITAALSEMGYNTSVGVLKDAFDYLCAERNERPIVGAENSNRRRGRGNRNSNDRDDAEEELGPPYEPVQTRAVAWRLFCLSRHGDPALHGQTISRDIEWLKYAQRDDGGWGEISPDYDKEAAKKDHSTNEISALVVEALREAHYAGKEIDTGIWRDAAEYWVKAQARDGGYRSMMEMYGGIGEKPTVMRTAAGLSSLLTTMDMAFAAGGRTCDQYRANRAQTEAIGRSWDWLTAFYRVRNPASLQVAYSLDEMVASGNDPFLQALYLFKATAVSGRNRIGDHNLFRSEARKLLDYYPRGTGVFGLTDVRTAQVLLSLASANAPTALQRIVVGGDEISPYKRDAEHIVRYLSRRYRKIFNWRETDIDQQVRDLVQAPILYLSIEAMPEWSDVQWNKLREYCFEGGVILVNVSSDCDAREEVEARFAKLFPEYKISKIDENDPIWSPNYTIPSIDGFDGRRRVEAWLSNEPDKVVKIDDDDENKWVVETKVKLTKAPTAIGNGLKHFVFFTPEDWSCVLQMNEHADNPDPFLFSLCLLAYTIDQNDLPGSMENSPYDPGALGSRTIQMTHMETGGLSSPAYPDLVSTLNRIMRANYRVNVEEVDASALDKETPELLWVTHTGEKSLSDDQVSAIRNQIQNGGYVYIDVVTGNESWGESMRGELQKIDPELQITRLPTAHPVYTGRIEGTLGFNVPKADLRTALRTKDESSGRCTMYKLLLNGREVGVYCDQDICSGVSHTQFPGVRGPMPTDARRLAMNVILRSMKHRAGNAKHAQ